MGTGKRIGQGKKVSQLASPFRKGDVVIVSDAALIYSGIFQEGSNAKRTGLVLSIQNARHQMNLDNDENMVETLLCDGSIEWLWEQDLVKLNS